MSNPLSNADFVEAAVTLNAGGNGAWLGWHQSRGWVFLDRSIEFNKRPAGQYCFVQASDWSLYYDDRDAWKNGVGYTYHARRFVSAGHGARDAMRLVIEALCREYLERCLEIRAQIDQLLLDIDEKARLDDMRHQAEVAAAQAEVARHREEERIRQRVARISALKNNMLARQRADVEGIRQVILERNITSLFHFTRLGNLPGIVATGLIPRCEHPDRVQYNDDQRLDDFPDATSLSVSFPNYKMFYRYRNLNPKLNWAILAISPETLIDHPSLFYSSNAAIYRFRNENDGERNVRMGVAGLISMFYDEPAGLRARRGIPLAWTTDPQAEVLVFATISPQRFNGIILLHPDAEATRLVQERLPNLPVAVGGKLFSARADYQYWQALDE